MSADMEHFSQNQSRMKSQLKTESDQISPGEEVDWEALQERFEQTFPKLQPLPQQIIYDPVTENIEAKGLKLMPPVINKVYEELYKVGKRSGTGKLKIDRINPSRAKYQWEELMTVEVIQVSFRSNVYQATNFLNYLEKWSISPWLLAKSIEMNADGQAMDTMQNKAILQLVFAPKDPVLQARMPLDVLKVDENNGADQNSGKVGQMLDFWKDLSSKDWSRDPFEVAEELAPLIPDLDKWNLLELELTTTTSTTSTTATTKKPTTSTTSTTLMKRTNLEVQSIICVARCFAMVNVPGSDEQVKLEVGMNAGGLRETVETITDNQVILRSSTYGERVLKIQSTPEKGEIHEKMPNQISIPEEDKILAQPPEGEELSF